MSCRSAMWLAEALLVLLVEILSVNAAVAAPKLPNNPDVACKSADRRTYGLMSDSFRKTYKRCASYKGNIQALMKYWRNLRYPLSDKTRTAFRRVLDSSVNGASAQSVLDTGYATAKAIQSSVSGSGIVKGSALDRMNEIVDFRGAADNLANAFYLKPANDPGTRLIEAYRTLMNHLESRLSPMLQARYQTSAEPAFKEGEALEMGLTGALIVFGENLTPWENSRYLYVLHRIAQLVYDRGVNLKGPDGSSVYQTPNKPIFEAAGLSYFALLFNDFKLSNDWLRASVDLIAEKFNSQVSPTDGSFLELESGYSSIVARRVFAAIVIQEVRKKRGDPPSVQFSSLAIAREQLLVEWLHKLAMPEAFMIPPFGDAVEGHRPKAALCSVDKLSILMPAGKTSFCRTDSGAAQEFELDELFLSGMLGVDSSRSLPRVQDPLAISSVVLNPSNIFILKDRLTPEQGGEPLLIHLYAMPKRYTVKGGSRGRSGHNHADFLSMTMYVGGKPLIIDPGIGHGYGEEEYKNLFRSLRAHSSVINEELSARNRCPGLPTPATGIPELACQGYTLDPSKIASSSWLNPPAITKSQKGSTTRATADLTFDGTAHRREVSFDRNAGTIQVTDTLTSTSVFHARSSFKLAPGLVPSIAPGTPNVVLVRDSAGAVVLRVENLMGTGFVIRGPGVSEDAYCHTFDASQAAGNCDTSRYDIVLDSEPGRYRKIYSIDVRGTASSYSSGGISGFAAVNKVSLKPQ